MHSKIYYKFKAPQDQKVKLWNKWLNQIDQVKSKANSLKYLSIQIGKITQSIIITITPKYAFLINKYNLSEALK